jgi:hypothetical protein
MVQLSDCNQDIILMTILSSIAVYVSYKLLHYMYDLWYYSRIPGLPIIPFIGNTFDFLKKKRGNNTFQKKEKKSQQICVCLNSNRVYQSS